MKSDDSREMTRREVLSVAIGVFGLASVRSGLCWAALPAPPIPNLGCSTVNFRKLSLREAMERIRRAGYSYVETQAVPHWCPHVDPWNDDPNRFSGIVRDMGFRGVSALWAPNGAIIADAKSVEGITQAIRWAKEADIPVVNAGDGRKADGTSDEEALKVLHDRLAQILEVAEKNRVYLAIEPHGTFSLTADGLTKIMALSSSKWLGINYDTANVHCTLYETGAPGAFPFVPYGKRQDEVATLAVVADRVLHVHVKDVIGSRCVVLGEGDVKIRRCLQVLKEHRYTGVLSVESEGELEAEDVQLLIEASRAYLARVSAEVWASR